MSSPRRSATLDEAVSTIRRQHPDFDRSYRAARKCIDEWIRLGWLPRDRIEGREILDWECGLGAFAARFLELGAARVVGIDSWLDPAYVDALLSTIPNAHFERISLEDYADRESERFDLVLANTVSEHLPDLSARLRDCGDVLAPTGELFINHDNYFQPVGSHDHGFLYYEGDSIVFQGVECWKLPEKCAASEVFLKEVRTRLPWTWDDGHDALRDPDACEQCPYYRRAQPWAHLIYQDDFRRLYPNVSFSSGYDESTLNKVSTFQLRQMLVESGFDIMHWYPSVVSNRPPPAAARPTVQPQRDRTAHLYGHRALQEGAK